MSMKYQYLTKEHLAKLTTEEVILLHQDLHANHGATPSDEICAVEKLMSECMRGRGIEHRHEDELAKLAGTCIPKDAQRPVTAKEVRAYLQPITVSNSALELVQDVNGGPIYLNVNSPLLHGASARLVKALNKCLPNTIQLKSLRKGADQTFAVAEPAYSLVLQKSTGINQRVTTWQALTQKLMQSAELASSVYKGRKDLAIPYTIVKEAMSLDEQIVTGVVLEPETIDRTKKDLGDEPTGAIGDIYSEEEIRKAMYWWMEEANHSFSYYHQQMGGYALSSQDVVLLENWQTRIDQIIGNQAIKKGTWMASTRIRSLSLWTDIKAGRINSWSIAAQCLGAIEEMHVSPDELPTNNPTDAAAA